MMSSLSRSSHEPFRQSIRRSDFLILVCFMVVFLLVLDRKVAPPVEWKPPPVASAMNAADHQGGAALMPDPENGKWLFNQTCTSCHGSQAQGLPHQGVDLRVSKFVSALSDTQLVEFLKTGRQPKDPKSQRGLLMPPRGGNTSLIDPELHDIVAFLREVQKPMQSPAKSAATRPALTSVHDLQEGIQVQ
jgi:cytochrome c5